VRALFALMSDFGVDQYTILAAIFGIFVRPLRRLIAGHRPCFDSHAAIFDAFNAGALIPFIYLIVSVFSKNTLDELLRSSKPSLGLAGIVGVIFVLTELISLPPRKPGSDPRPDP